MQGATTSPTQPREPSPPVAELLAGTIDRREVILDAVTFAAERFLAGDPVDDALPEVLRRMGEASGAGRVVLVERVTGEDGSHMRPRSEWDRVGVAALAIGPDPIGLRYFPRWERELSAGRLVTGHTQDMPDDERVLLEADRVGSIVVTPITVGGRWWGHVGYDDAHSERVWTGPELDALRAAAGIIGAAVERETTEARLRQVARFEAVGRVAGGLAHDFGNLLTIVRGRAELLLQTGLDDASREDVEAILHASDRGADLVRDLLTFSRKRSGAIEAVDLNDQVVRAERILGRTVGPAIRIEIATDRSIPAVRADPGELEHVLVNLVVNARDAMPDGGTIRIETRLAEAPEGPLVAVDVSDTGIGMDEATRTRVFEPFFSTKPEDVGSGLGLPTAYATVTSWGGTIDVASEVGAGTTFTLLLRPAADS